MANDYRDPVSAFRDAMLASGLACDAPLTADGSLHRFHVEGDKRGRENGWYVLHLSPVPAGAFGSWRTGLSEIWRLGGNVALSPFERAKVDAAIAEGKRLRAAETQARQEAAQRRAVARWKRAQPADPMHPYLRTKGVGAHGLRQEADVLLIPMHSADGALWGLQAITSDGAKRFMAGSRKRGLYHALGGTVTDCLLIAEGYATAATLLEATSYPTFCAFDCGNLEPVAKALRSKYPRARIVVCADDDVQTEARTGRNPGLEAATRAAQAVAGFVAVPPVRGAA